MAKPRKEITPADKLEKWKGLWSTPKKLDDDQAEAAFEEFCNNFIPSHMTKRFLKFFGYPHSKYGNRFFMDDAMYHTWNTPLEELGLDSDAEVILLYAFEEDVEAHSMKGRPRRTVKDVFIDDWQEAAAIIRATDVTVYMFVEPRMKGVVARGVANS